MISLRLDSFKDGDFGVKIRASLDTSQITTLEEFYANENHDWFKKDEDCKVWAAVLKKQTGLLKMEMRRCYIPRSG